MIRKLTMEDDQQVQTLIQQKPAENLFIIGDIEAFGYDQDFQTVWGDFDNNNLRAILLKYEKNYIPFALDTFDANGFAKIINEDPDQPMLSGLKDITAQIEPYLTITYQKKRETHYAKLTSNTQLPLVNTHAVKLLTSEDVDRLGAFLTNVREFDSLLFNAESKRRNLEKGVTRGYYIENNGQIVSTASTTAENTKSAMVVAVATAESYQQKGLATRCLTKLCKDLVTEGKQLCLFYDNPNAGKLYKRIGFEDIGIWMMYR
ncbi:Acetyltransferase (GNAT) family protein [Paraliobacillus sp. PM-2]|uniref:GNAT family N-acetyltransferase n=1 Tax=Paraliobacillus sp. PM-2 TaxID=1462524 RepID=UPI00061C705F|nr:GNAT family N-acetyltransferase [Paraliobacillus sp. PM-2]CQR46137.1 Acetyltransferase (GNAT) family protein [Paraliobacillus sp. PM-2]